MAWAGLAGLEQDVMRVNLMTVSRRETARRAHVPRTVKAGISSGGRVASTVELVLFGLWLFGTGEGYRPIRGRGRRADLREVFGVVAAALLAMWWREERGDVGEGSRESEKGSKRRPLSRSELSRAWLALHGDHHDRDWFKSRMASAARHLAAYVEELREGRGPLWNSKRLTSPQLWELRRLFSAE
jgi:hypothetical protein